MPTDFVSQVNQAGKEEWNLPIIKPRTVVKLMDCPNGFCNLAYRFPKADDLRPLHWRGFLLKVFEKILLPKLKQNVMPLMTFYIVMRIAAKGLQNSRLITESFVGLHF